MLTKKDRLIPWYFVAFFVAIALIDSVFVYMAVSTNTGVVTDHPYEKGLAYNKVVAAEEKQAKLGWSADISYSDGIIAVILKDSNGKILNPDTLTADFIRPSHDGIDFSLAIKDGRVKPDFPLNGLWEVRIFANIEGQSYQQSKRFVVK